MDKLMAEGLTRQQVESKTAEKVVQVFMNADKRTILQEAQAQVVKMEERIQRLYAMYEGYGEAMKNQLKVFVGAAEAEQKYGVLTDDRAKNAATLFGTCIEMALKSDATPGDAVTYSSAIVSAYLGGHPTYETTKFRKEEL